MKMTSLSNPNPNQKKQQQQKKIRGTEMLSDSEKTSLWEASDNRLLKSKSSHDSALETPSQSGTSSQQQEVEELTREQYKSARWHKERKYKLTSSRFGEICKRRKYDLKYCESLSTNQKDISHIPAVRFGLNQEKVALEQFKQWMSRVFHL